MIEIATYYDMILNPVYTGTPPDAFTIAYDNAILWAIFLETLSLKIPVNPYT